MTFPIYQPAGDCGVLISYEEKIDPKINERVRLFSEILPGRKFPWIEETIFSYRSLLVIYDQGKIRYGAVVEILKDVEHHLVQSDSCPPDLYEIPTVYGGTHGPDLDRVSGISGLSPKEVIELYSSTTFTIYFLGFLCAQPYLGGLPERLHVPRLDNPRLFMPAGSVGIGGIQASLLTIDQPSGHNFIGRTFLSLYDPNRIPPTVFKAGDQVRYLPMREEKIPDFKGRAPSKRGRGVK